ncbi:hypothetical protein JTE90_026767 [Oedothorax gibbosus]|uniref:Uncharacterized protein n=1 Tax=Oedothorax gibbosus TaxID=931172 RepID=A0AAV6UY70_9ARAC|nr:hypothetical protein JTE90_026767 [Oedothorax gibbosus]
MSPEHRFVLSSGRALHSDEGSSWSGLVCKLIVMGDTGTPCSVCMPGSLRTSIRYSDSIASSNPHIRASTMISTCNLIANSQSSSLFDMPSISTCVFSRS